jgi:hypothetical protein
MSDIAGFDMTPDSGSTLRKVLKLELGEHMEIEKKFCATKMNKVSFGIKLIGIFLST